VQDIEYYMKSFEMKRKIMQNEPVEGDLGTLYEKYISQKPVVFCIETTTACNMRCIMCPRTDKMKRPIGHMKPTLYQKIIDQIEPYTALQHLKWRRFLDLKLFPSHILSNIDEDFFNYVVSAESLTLHGFGEPPLDPHIIDRINIATQNNIPTYFSCNPINMTDKLFNELVDAGLNYLKYSIDGLDEKTIEKYRGKKIDMRQVEERIKKSIGCLKKHNAATILVLTMLEFGGNIKQNEAFVKRWQDQEVFAYIKNSHHRWLFDENGTPENTSTWVHCFCEYPFNSVSILYDGTVVPCPLDYDGIMAMGNVNESSLEEIWHSKQYVEFRKMHAAGCIANNHFCKASCDMRILGEVADKAKTAKGTAHV